MASTDEPWDAGCAMEDLRTYEFTADADILKEAYQTGSPPEHLESPFRAIVSEIVSRVRSRSLSIYLCSADEDAEARNYFAFVLTRLIREHVSSAVLVDCDFLSVGLSEMVPHRDAIGFLDLLLYGSSLGVITQEAKSGVRIVGAGSFPVTKKSPFVMEAFAGARRYLVSQTKCTVFCGPALDDDEFVHPIASHVDLAILVRLGGRFNGRFLDALEEKVHSVEGSEVWSVRVNTRLPIPEAPPPPEAVERPEKFEPTLVAEVKEVIERAGEDRPTEPLGTRATQEPPETPVPPPTSAPKKKTVPPGVEVERKPVTVAGVGDEDLSAPRLGRKSSGSRVLRIITTAVSVVVVVFVLWWLYLTKSVREREQELAGLTTVVDKPPTEVGQVVDSLRGEPSAAVEGGSEAEETRLDTEVEVAATSPVEEPQRTEGRREDVAVTDDLDEFANQYLVHVSSFRRLDNARDEAFYLLGWGYPVFIYRVDLGSKGMWYRVYVGPCATREDANQHKIKLDDNPRILSTRIARVPG